MDLFILNIDQFDKMLFEKRLSQNEFSQIAGVVPQTFCRARRGHAVRMSTVRRVLAAIGGRNEIRDFFAPTKTKV